MASVIGTVFFVVVFMLALGSMAYASGIQSQTNAAEAQAQLNASRRGAEVLTFTTGPTGLVATDDGPTSVVVNHLVLRYPNGTVYSLSASATVSTGGAASVQSLVPSGVCSPGTATCLSKYKQIVSGNPAGSAVGLVTSMGNTFWYAYSSNQVSWSSLTGFPPACPAGETISKLNTTLTCSVIGSLTSWASATVASGAVGKYSSTGLSVPLSANTKYAFYVFVAIEPTLGTESYNFEVHALPAGASLLIACTPMSYPTGGGSEPTNCVTSPDTPIGAYNNLAFGVAPPVFATPGIFGVVSVGASPGTLQIDFACTAFCGGVNVEAGSFMLVQPVG